MGDGTCEVCKEAPVGWTHETCSEGCLAIYETEQRVERETIARVVAWLRNQREERGLFRSVDALAHELESGAWKEGE